MKVVGNKFVETSYNIMDEAKNASLISKVTRSILVREEKNQINVSLRSVGDVPVNKIAELFGGGGHKNAAGCEFDVPLKEALERLKKVL